MNDRITQRAVEQVIQFLKNENYVDFARRTLPLMDSYNKKFVNKPPKKQASTTATVAAAARAVGVGVGVVDDEKFNSLHNQADVLARKSYFLLLYAFDEVNFEIMRSLAEELNEYMTTYID